MCSVACKMVQEELEELCRREKIYCRDLGVSRSNINDYEVEFLCDYKKTKVSPRRLHHRRSHAPPSLLLRVLVSCWSWNT